MENPPLVEPSSVSSVNGVLHTSLHLQVSTHRIHGRDFTTRTLNGTIPGPTLRLKPGDTLIIDFYNDLVDRPDEKPYVHNQFSAPNDSNLHFHGLHVSGELPSDDTTLTVGAGQSYRYVTKLPDDHLPGTHWIHPHHHGSTALQVGGGTAGTIIVQDDFANNDNSNSSNVLNLPPQVVQAREILLVAQEMDFRALRNIMRSSRDSIVSLSDVVDEASLVASGGNVLDAANDKMYLINGRVNPRIDVATNEWVRLRIVHVGWLNGRLDLELPGCQMQLLAKDGVYLPDLPRPIERALLVNAARADILVSCPSTGGVHPLTCTSNICNGQHLATIVTESSASNPPVEATSIQPVQLEFPRYLQDLCNTDPSPGCSCATEVDDLEYPAAKGTYFHETYQGAIVERQLDSENHPYHQHVHPFQIVGGAGNDPFYRVGDWHDTLQGNRRVRYQVTEFTGKMMIHCHRLDHEDEGMMWMEYIHPYNQSAAALDANYTAPSCVCVPQGIPPIFIALFVLGILFVLTTIGVGIVWCCRRRGKCLWCPCPWPCGADAYLPAGAGETDDKDEEQPVEAPNLTEGKA